MNLFKSRVIEIIHLKIKELAHLEIANLKGLFENYAVNHAINLSLLPVLSANQYSLGLSLYVV
jgi:hypothetical protein